MTTIHERSAGVIPYRREGGQGPLVYLVLHSATVRNPRAKWEFPKGGMESGESAKETAAREFQEETGLSNWSFREGFERSLSYTYIRRGRKVIKTVTYYVVEVADDSTPTRSIEHVEDPFGHWCYWGTFEQVSRLLYHAKIRHVFAEADAWLRDAAAPSPSETADGSD
jgi:8-oxo-dGTP pyrophosphatase MutT (NUDIX family)